MHYRYCFTSRGSGDADDEREDGCHDERPQRTGVNDLDELVYRTNLPFTALVTLFPLPPKFRMPQVETYDESKDPLDHLKSFRTLMHLQGVVDEIMCRAFPATLKGLARIWFSKLTPNSIGTFKELSA